MSAAKGGPFTVTVTDPRVRREDEVTRQNRIALLASVVLAVGVWACRPGSGVGSTTSSSAAGEAETTSSPTTQELRGNVLVAAQREAPDRLDPHLATSYASFQVLENIYDALVEPGPDMRMQPALASRWEVSEDGLTWTFFLRDDVVFHNGRPLTADDVVYSLERVMDPDVGAVNSFRLATIESVEALDDYTVRITLSRPTPNLLANIGGLKGLAIVPREIVEDGTIDSRPVGTGPFRFVSASPEEGILLERNPDYWRADEGLPYLDGIRFVQMPDPAVELNALLSGEVDWIDTVPPEWLDGLKGDGRMVFETVPAGDYAYFALNQRREPFDDVRVRRAIAMAIDREAIAEAARFGVATPNQTAIPPSSFWYHDYAPYRPADLEGARALLEEAGVEGLTIEFLVTSDFPETVTGAEIIADQLQPLGIEVRISDVDFATWLDRQAAGEFDAVMLSWFGNIDPEDFYYAQHHSEGKFNFQGYSNPEVDALLDAARGETDQPTRKQLYDQAAELIVDDASYVYLYNPDNVQAWAPYVTGYRVRSDEAVRFVETKIRR